MSLLGLVRGLVAARVRFVVIGGVAARAHGSTRITEDLDICYDTAADNLERLATLLANWNAYPRGVDPGLPFIMDAQTLASSPILTLTTREGDIDLIDVVEGVGSYDKVVASSVEIAVDELRFRALDLEGLLKAKQATRRPKDLEQVPELEALIELRRKQRRRGGSG